MRPLTSLDMGDSGGSPWRRPKLALPDGESLVFCESLLLGVILHCIHNFCLSIVPCPSASACSDLQLSSGEARRLMT